MLNADGYIFEANRSLIYRIPKRKQQAGVPPSERFLSNTGGADVSIRTLESHPSSQAQPSPPRPENLSGRGDRKLDHHYRCRSRTSGNSFSPGENSRRRRTVKLSA